MLPLNQAKPTLVQLHTRYIWDTGDSTIMVFKGYVVGAGDVPSSIEVTFEQAEIDRAMRYVDAGERRNVAQRKAKLAIVLPFLPADGTAIPLRSLVPAPYAYAVVAWSILKSLYPDVVLVPDATGFMSVRRNDALAPPAPATANDFTSMTFRLVGETPDEYAVSREEGTEPIVLLKADVETLYRFPEDSPVEISLRIPNWLCTKNGL